MLLVQKANFSFAITVMEKVEVRNEEKWLVAPRYVHVGPTAKQCYVMGMRGPVLDLQSPLGIIMESASWVTENFLWENEWISALPINWDCCRSQHRQISIANSWTMEQMWQNSEKQTIEQTIARSSLSVTFNIAFGVVLTPRTCFLFMDGDCILMILPQ